MERLRLTDTILQLGDPRLRRVSQAVKSQKDPRFRTEKELLFRTLEAFRGEYGFGRAIAAPQIGISRRFIALNLGGDPFVMVNPVFTWKSEETFTMWDDCMCFPFLLVKVRRHRTVCVEYRDEGGATVQWEKTDQAISELMQHEIDHLDGILATDRQEGEDGLISRTVYEANRQYFDCQVEYRISAPGGKEE